METTHKKHEEKFKISGNWETQSKKLKAKFPLLTDSDLKFEVGKENEMLGRIEKRLSKNREEVIEIISHLQTEKV
jgi:hypothetical protein